MIYYISAEKINHEIVMNGRIIVYDKKNVRQLEYTTETSSKSSFQWTRRNIHIDTECRDHGLVCSSIAVLVRLVFIKSLYKNRCPPLFFDLVDVAEEVRKRLPTVPVVEWRRHNKCTVFVSREASLNLKK